MATTNKEIKIYSLTRVARYGFLVMEGSGYRGV